MIPLSYAMDPNVELNNFLAMISLLYRSLVFSPSHSYLLGYRRHMQFAVFASPLVNAFYCILVSLDMSMYPTDIIRIGFTALRSWQRHKKHLRG